jgi:hypothetical protein
MSTTFCEMSSIQPGPLAYEAPSPAPNCSLNALIPRPIPNSYWVTQWLLACEYPWCPLGPSTSVLRQKIDALLAAGVRTFVDLTEPNELRPYGAYLAKRAQALGLSDIEYHRFPIPDRCLPASVEYMRKILEVLRDNEQRERISAVHCRSVIRLIIFRSLLTYLYLGAASVEREWLLEAG